jgi:hypothetical protein
MSRWEFSLGHLNPVCVKRPIGKYLFLAKFHFRQLSCLSPVRGFDFHIALADFGLMAVFAKDILQKSYNKAGHEESLADWLLTNLSLVRHRMQQLTQVKTRV